MPLAAEPPRVCGSCKTEIPTPPRPLHSRLAAALSEASTSAVGRVAFVLLIAVVTSGCANYSSNEVRRPVTGTTASKTPPLSE
jgi:hypothetical protein